MSALDHGDPLQCSGHRGPSGETRTDFSWTNSHHIAGDLREGVQKLKDATPAGVLLGSGKLATELDRLDLIDEYKLLVHPRIAGHGPTLYQSGHRKDLRSDSITPAGTPRDPRDSRR